MYFPQGLKETELIELVCPFNILINFPDSNSQILIDLSSNKYYIKISNIYFKSVLVYVYIYTFIYNYMFIYIFIYIT